MMPECRIDITPCLCATMAGMTSVPVFPLRLRNPRLRELAKEIARRESISQNELIEQALEHELVARGAMWVDDLRSAADRFAELTQEQYAAVMARSIEDFPRGEGRSEPLLARRITCRAVEVAPSAPGDDRLGVIAAFNAVR